MKKMFPGPYQRFLRHSWNVLSHTGLRYACPCCGWRFRKMQPFGRFVPRANARCPRCGSMERHRLLWLYLHQKTNLFSRHCRLLHVAPEPVFQKYLQAQPTIEYVSTDIAAPLVDLRMDLTAMAYQDNSFDVILCSHVLEHIQDDRAAMRELFRILKPGGWAIMQVPLEAGRATTFEDVNITSDADRLQVFYHPEHVRVYGRDYKDRLEQAGFQVFVDGYVRELDTKLVSRYCLDVNEDVYVCSKDRRSAHLI